MRENMISVDTLEIPELEIYNVLSENRLYHINEPDEGLFIAESAIVIGRALDAGYEPFSLLVSREELDKEAKGVIERLDKFPSVKIYVAAEEVLKKITGYNITRGVFCAMKRKKLKSASEICKDAKRVAVLENVSNPTNVGAIMRNAAALNMDAVLFTKGSSDPLYRRAIRVSMGTVFQIPWTIAGDDWMNVLKKHGFTTVAMALEENSVELGSFRRNGRKTAVILGTEGEGLRNTTITGCDMTVRIPMSNGVDSLNVAAASALAFWQIANVK